MSNLKCYFALYSPLFKCSEVRLLRHPDLQGKYVVTSGCCYHGKLQFTPLDIC